MHTNNFLPLLPPTTLPNPHPTPYINPIPHLHNHLPSLSLTPHRSPLLPLRPDRTPLRRRLDRSRSTRHRAIALGAREKRFQSGDAGAPDAEVDFDHGPGVYGDGVEEGVFGLCSVLVYFSYTGDIERVDKGVDEYSTSV